LVTSALTPSPSPFWNPTIIVSDNHIPAFGVDMSVYEFEAPPSGTVTVEATLILRRAF